MSRLQDPEMRLKEASPSSEPITFVKVVETCMACPSQWDAWDADGNYYYLRFRHGKGTLEHLPSENPADWGPKYPAGENLRAWFRTGHGLDGCISLEDFLTNTNCQLSDEAVVTVPDYGEY